MNRLMSLKEATKSILGYSRVTKRTTPSMEDFGEAIKALRKGYNIKHTVILRDFKEEEL